MGTIKVQGLPGIWEVDTSDEGEFVGKSGDGFFSIVYWCTPAREVRVVNRLDVVEAIRIVRDSGWFLLKPRGWGKSASQQAREAIRHHYSGRTFAEGSEAARVLDEVDRVLERMEK